MLRILAWVLLFILLAYICGVFTAGPLNDMAQDTFFSPLAANEGDVAQQALSSQFGQTFPPSATGFYRANRGDEVYWLRVSVAPGEINNLFSGSDFVTCRFPLQPAYRPVFDYNRILAANEQAALNWWTPNDSSIRVYSGGECTGTDYRIFRMFVDQTNASQWTLFMEVVRT